MQPPGIILSLAIYGLIWFVVLFAILPIGIQTQGEVGTPIEGTESSAPVHPRLGLKFLITSLVAGGVYAVVYVVLVLLAD